jgi:hypothetical protein
VQAQLKGLPVDASLLGGPAGAGGNMAGGGMGLPMAPPPNSFAPPSPPQLAYPIIEEDTGAAAAAAFYNSGAADVDYDTAYGARSDAAMGNAVAGAVDGGGFGAQPPMQQQQQQQPVFNPFSSVAGATYPGVGGGYVAPRQPGVPGRSPEESEIARLEQENSVLRCVACVCVFGRGALGWRCGHVGAAGGRCQGRVQGWPGPVVG